MNIQDALFGSFRPDQHRTSSVEKAGKAEADAASQASTAPSAPSAVSDRVEISQTARSASAEKDHDLRREVEFARRAMYSIPPMSPEQAEKLLDRLNSGEYDAPDVRMNLAEALTKEIAPHTPEAGGEA